MIRIVQPKSISAKWFATSLTVMWLQIFTHAQNVGIGTNSPSRKLSVSGSIMVDHGNQNSGTLDSAALLFGTGGVGVFSKKVGPGMVNGLTLVTGNQGRVNIDAAGNIGIGGLATNTHRLYLQNGNTRLGGNLSVDEDLTVSGIIRTNSRMGINAAPDPLYSLRLQGNSYLSGDLHLTGNVAFGGDLDPNYRLRVWNGNTRLGGDMYATGRAAIGGDVDNNFRLRVYGGNSRFGGDVEITGITNTSHLAVGNSLTIGGKGAVRSNGTTPLRIHFTSVFVDHSFTGSGQLAVFELNLPDFSHIDDIRLAISHFEPLVPVGYNPQNVYAYFSDLDPVENKAILVLRAIGSHNFIIGGTYYITAFLKDN